MIAYYSISINIYIIIYYDILEYHICENICACYDISKHHPKCMVSWVGVH